MTVYKLEKEIYKNDIFKIKPYFHLPSNYIPKNIDLFIESIESLLFEILPKDFIEHKNLSKDDLKNIFLKLNQSIPLFYTSEFKNPPFCLSFSLLCSADHTHGIGRFIGDLLSKWLMPGRSLAINSHRSLMFSFIHNPNKNLYISEYFISVDDTKQLNLLKNNLSSFIEELKIILLSVYNARQIVSTQKLSQKQKSIMIQENLDSLLDKNQKAGNSAFDQMHNFMVKLSHEKKLSEIKENLAYLMNKKPINIDRDIFDSIHNVSLLFKGSFSDERSPKHISRIISYQYLFKKSLKQVLSSIKTQKRHIYLKLLQTKYANKESTTLGILIVMNLLHENEHFEKGYILDALSGLIKDYVYVDGSYVIDYRDDKMLSFYLEIDKLNAKRFQKDEINDIRDKLHLELKYKMLNVVHPIFLPRNEEEVLRNIIVLSKQLKYVKDIPQVIISYDKQTQKEISFNIILLRLIKKNTTSLKEAFSNSIIKSKYFEDEVKIVGKLKNKYPKEANIFRLNIKKFPFLRRDYSLDLRKARLFIVNELKRSIKDFRDFNGGMISKQCESLDDLKASFCKLKKHQEFYLENFFYSLRPGIMQTILDTSILKNFYLLLMDLISQSLSEKKCTIKTLNFKKHYFIIIGSSSSKFKEEVIYLVNKIKLSSFELTSASFNTNDVFTLGYILQSEDEKKKKLLHDTITEAISHVF
ncbi:MAG: hypothetical protein K1060chlam5_00281 [Candidatus Anoxychlamydiales bacterium]|nr:hypothetical protein [Candidatus Anoxychlamydiales bacterium]